jgi:hypothetical protein
MKKNGNILWKICSRTKLVDHILTDATVSEIQSARSTAIFIFIDSIVAYRAIARQRPRNEPCNKRSMYIRCYAIGG